MKEFVRLYFKLDETNSTNKKIALLKDYFLTAPAQDAIWVVYFFSGYRFKRLVSSKLLRKWVREHYDIPKWLFDESMVAVGDTGETISLLVDTYRDDTVDTISDLSVSEWIDRIQDLQYLSTDEQKLTILYWWDHLEQEHTFLVNKLLTGAFRVGVSKQTVANALSEAYDIEKSVILHRMMGKWEPTTEFYQELIREDDGQVQLSLPYPFYLASPLEQQLEDLGEIEEWFVEWKWDGIRAQLIKRDDKIFLWSRGEELINQSFPNIINAMQQFPNGTVLDGEILAYFNNQPLAFSVLQRRIGRQEVTSTILKEAPVIFMIYDIMEYDGKDIRDKSHHNRRQILEEFIQISDIQNFKLSPLVSVQSWDQVREHWKHSREMQAEGLMLKRKEATYKVGRKRGDWYKFKVDPLSLDVVLIYAQSGSGRRANLFTAYTFAVLADDGASFVPIGRAYSGLTDDEIAELDSWIRSHTKERFGPVRSVDPVQVFELGFDGVMTNDKTKSGMSLRFPRMLRWRKEKPVDEIDTLSSAHALLKYEGITEIKRNMSLDDFF